MKKNLLLLLTVLFCFFFNAQAQIKKDAVLLGGDLAASSQKTSIPDSVLRKEQVLSSTFSYGKAIRDNLIFGGSVSWRHQHNKDESIFSSYNTNAWGLGAFLRKYKQLGSSGFYFFAQATVSGQYLRGTSKYGDVRQAVVNEWTASVQAYPGISFALSRKLQIETGLPDLLRIGYDRTETDYAFPSAIDQISKTFSFSSSIETLSNLYVGFRILLN